jgi:hypothetical protein
MTRITRVREIVLNVFGWRMDMGDGGIVRLGSVWNVAGVWEVC